AMLDAFETLLAAAVRDPQCRIDELPVLSPMERWRILDAWNDTARPFCAERGIHELFEDVAERMPEAVAATLGEASISYGELNRRANGLARQLRARGVSSETAVAIAVEPSFEMLVGVLATLKAGGAYVPLDPQYPDERLRFIIRDSGARVVVTQARLRDRIAGTSVPIILIDGASDESEREPCDAVSGARGGDAPAYIIYTSGSTGKPKGVIVPHRAVTRLVIATDYVPFGPDLTIAQISNFSFDAATFELWGALLHGARLVIVPKDVLLSPPDFLALLQREQIGAMFVTTAFFNQLARLSPGAFANVRYLLTGGEQVDPGAMRAVLAAARPAKLIHVYGPTETTTFASAYAVDELGDKLDESIPIGRPIANTRLYVLDPRRRPVPIGVAGELYIGGPGVAIGYLNAPELTAQHFVPDPFDDAPPGVLYRTGDRVRYRPDGAIEFLGRLDRQVKIRGFRVEPQEVETILARHPAVDAAVVDVEEDGSGSKRLAAYIVPRETQASNAHDLRAFLARTLPDYMLPATLSIVDAVPLTPNGKIDRHALRASSRPAAPATVDEERNPLELHLALLWDELLRCGPIGPTDDFFALGGHSLLVVLLMRRIEETFGRRLPVSTLFAEPTIRHLANVLISDARVEARDLLITVRAAGSQPPFFFLHGDLTGGGYYCRALEPALGEEQPFYLFAPHGSDGNPPPSSIEEMAADYVTRLQRVRPRGPYRLGGFCSAGLIAFEMARLLERKGERVDRLVLIDTPVRGTRYLSLADAAGGVALLAGASERHARELRAFVARRLESVERLLQASWSERARLVQRKLQRRFAGAAPQGGIDLWRGVSAHYVPRRFGGTATLLWCSDRSVAERERYSRRWEAVAAGVKTGTIPGDHLGSITSNLAQTAALIAGAVRGVPA
ncbi:MAG TPA: amino acid adenylation domain-containing protein, partial [Candidatus Acidoferrum sp.]|nr:amino acid adenylation domain-containing protein [Candidatus Acidoferrum sp.]